MSNNDLPDDHVHGPLLRLLHERRERVRAVRLELDEALLALENAAGACALLRIPVPADDQAPPAAAPSGPQGDPPAGPVPPQDKPAAPPAAADAPLVRKPRLPPLRSADRTTKRTRDAHRMRTILGSLLTGPRSVQELARILGESGETVRGVIKKQGRRRLVKTGWLWSILPEARDAVVAELEKSGRTQYTALPSQPPAPPVSVSAAPDVCAAVTAYMTRAGAPVMLRDITANVPYKLTDVMRVISSDARFVRRSRLRWALREPTGAPVPGASQLPLPAQAAPETKAPVPPVAPEEVQTTGAGTDSVTYAVSPAVSAAPSGVAPRALVCHECGNAMYVDERGVSYHMTADGAVDHDADGDHVALSDAPEDRN